MTKRLQRGKRVVPSGRIKRRPKGSSPERRARQAALVRGWQPWRRSTGPKTEAGKACCAKNALRDGYRSRAYIHKLRRVRHALRLAARNNELAFIRLRQISARPRIKYKLPLAWVRSESAPARGSRLRDGPFRALRLRTRIAATHPAHAFGEDHRWPSASR